jgi:nicotinate-nucleotide adenylyltransferase
MKRVALIGGAFNPPHEGHRRLAERALAHLDLDEVRFVPTAASPHKPAPEGGQAVDGATRLALLQELLRGLPGPCRVEPLEIERGGVSYTADTLDLLRTREPDVAWILVMGSDQARDFLRWRRAEHLLTCAAVAVVPRPGQEADLPEGLQARLVARWSGAPGEVVRLPSSGVACASSDLRASLHRGETPAGLSPEVLAAIAAKTLYRE